MSSVFYDYFENTSLLDVLQLYWGTAILFITDTLNFSFETLAKLVQKSPASEYLEDFTDFEVKLLKIFSTILLTNLLAIFIIWRVYGQRICDRFSNLSTLEQIEELKAGVARLNLPKEFTPRL